MDHEKDFQSVLAGLRAELDALDTRLVALLKERAGVIERVIEAKARHGLGPVDPVRERQMLERIEKQATDVDLDPRIASRILRAVIAAFTDTETKALGDSA